MTDEEIRELLEKLLNKKYKLNVPSYIDTIEAVEKIESKPAYEKKHCNNEERKRQQEQLKQCILSLDKENFFRVFNMECNTGKTYAMIDSISYYIKKVFFDLSMNKSLKMQGNVGVLIVLRQILECEKYSDYLNKLFGSEFSNTDISISATSNKYKSDDPKIKNKLRGDLLAKIPYIPIVFITHEEYCLLAENEDLRKIYTTNRRLLIIDESIDICETLEVTNKSLEQLEKVLSLEDRFIFKKICKPVQDKITSIEEQEENNIRNLAYNFKIKDDELFDLIEYFKNKVIPKFSSLEKVFVDLNRTVKCIKYLYKDNCLITKRKLEKDNEKETEIIISTINRDRKMWTLDTNIILDASAKLNPKYEMNKDLYVVMNNSPVLDHSLWNIKNIWIGSTKYYKALDKKYKTEKEKNRIKKFYKGCANVINFLGANDTLVVCNKKEHIIETVLPDEEKHIQKFNPFQNYGCDDIPVDHIEHFGNITGKREFANLKNVFIAHTYNYTDTEYILQYIYYKDLHLKNNTEFKQKQIDRLGFIYIFDDMELQAYKEKVIANHMYQAICRVNREMEHSTTVVIASKYLGSMLYVRDMFRVEDKEKQHCDFEITNYFNDVFGIYKKIGMNDHNQQEQENSLPFYIKTLFEKILNNNVPSDLKYTIADKYIIKVTSSNLYKYFNIDKDNKKETQKFSDALLKINDFKSDNVIIKKGNTFNFILTEPIS